MSLFSRSSQLNADGPKSEYRKGTNPELHVGPDKSNHQYTGSKLAKGPERSLRQGPQSKIADSSLSVSHLQNNLVTVQSTLVTAI